MWFTFCIDLINEWSDTFNHGIVLKMVSNKNIQYRILTEKSEEFSVIA